MAFEAEPSQEAETVHSSIAPDAEQRALEHVSDQDKRPGGSSEDQQAAAEELCQILDCDERAQSWDALWGPPTAAVSDPLPEDADRSADPQDSWGVAGANAGPQQEAQRAGQNRWEDAWEGSLATGVPDQAGKRAPAVPEQDAAWDPDTTRAPASAPPEQQDFTLLLPSREPPPPPAPAGAEAQSMAQHESSAAQREYGLPAMRPEDRQKCERFYAQVCIR